MLVQNPWLANVINAFVLLVMGLTAYFTSDAEMIAKKTALIGPIGAIILLILTPGFKKHNKAIAHVVVLLTFILLLLFAVGYVMSGFDNMFIVASAFSCLLAMIIFILNFRWNRKQREAAE